MRNTYFGIHRLMASEIPEPPRNHYTPRGKAAKRVLLALTCVILASGAGTNAKIKRRVPEKARQQARTNLKQLNRDKAFMVGQKVAARNRKREINRRLRDIQSQLRDNKHRTNIVNQRLQIIDREMAQTQAMLNRVHITLTVRDDLLAKRLVATQRHGSVRYAAVFFHSADYWDFLARKRLMARVISDDARLVGGVRRNENDVIQLRAHMEAAQARQTQLKNELDERRKTAEQLHQEVAVLAVEANLDYAYASQILDELDRNSLEIEQFLRGVEASPEGRRRAAIPYNGRFEWPVNGPITSQFGSRSRVRRYRPHSGIDFGVSLGTPIHAADSGIIVHASRWGAYGNAVLIDHGGGVSTLYGHMMNGGIRCRVGQSVRAGDVIGLVGSTGNSTGPHCHFEVRRNGRPVNPAQL